MIFTFYRALGMSTGSSMVEEEFVDMARGLIEKAKAKGVKLLLPKDVVVADKFAADAATKMVRNLYRHMPALHSIIHSYCPAANITV